MSVRVIVLAAGKGTRMKTDMAKVVHEAAGRTLLQWALSELEALDVVETAVVVGHQADDVAARCPEGVTGAVQEEVERLEERVFSPDARDPTSPLRRVWRA